MNRLLLLVEGATEEEFVNSVLREHLWTFDVDTSATQVCTRRIDGRRVHRGGGKNYDSIRDDLLRLLGSRPDAVSTMLDYYALPTNFPGRADVPAPPAPNRVAHLERAFGQDISDRRFIPNLIVHEFEALLFTAPEQLKPLFTKPTDRTHLDKLLASVASPEEINDGEQTAPSKRVLSWIPDYQKAFHGPAILKQVGLARIRVQCPHFDAWVATLERLGSRKAA